MLMSLVACVLPRSWSVPFVPRISSASLFVAGAATEHDAIEDDTSSEDTFSSFSFNPIPFSPPTIDGLLFVETFQGEDVLGSTWRKSGHEKFKGLWEISRRREETVIGDFGLKMASSAVHHGISCHVPRMETNLNQHFIIQYEAKFEHGLSCGGAYLKLFDLKGENVQKFNSETDYVIMFGPDKCAATNKVHFILKHKTPTNGKWTEHHMTDPPIVPSGSDTHLYTLWIKPDESFQVRVDDVPVRDGYLNVDMYPPIIPPTSIPDVQDKKPEHWDDRQTIPDSTAVKPVDWHEDAPEMIPDPHVTMPTGWLVSEQKMILDNSAVQPKDWDVEEDGVWIPPSIPNPKCQGAPGCGPFTPPMIRNPAYQGKWYPPMVPNPNYQGTWNPRMIPNPDYFEDKHLHALNSIDSVGFELWTMQPNILFDNIVISRDQDALRKFTESTWKIRTELDKKAKAERERIEKAAQMEEPSFNVELAMELLSQLYEEYPLVLFGGGLGMVFVVILMIACWWWSCHMKKEKLDDEHKDTAAKVQMPKPQASANAKESDVDNEKEVDSNVPFQPRPFNSALRRRKVNQGTEAEEAESDGTSEEDESDDKEKAGAIGRN